MTIDFVFGRLEFSIPVQLLGGLDWASRYIMKQHPLLSCGRSGSIVLLLKLHLHSITTACQSVNSPNFTTVHAI